MVNLFNKIMMSQKTIGFIGAGNMSRAIIFGLIQSGYPANKILASNPSQEKLDILAKLGVQTFRDNHKVMQSSEVVILAVKPQIMADICTHLQDIHCQHKLILSIAAGISVQRLHQLLPSAKAIIRVMPNTPSLIGEGMSGLFANPHCTDSDKTIATTLLSAVGKVCWVSQESNINTVIAASGSSPAYFFYFLEIMQKKVMQLGLSSAEARLLVQQAMLGAAKMVVENPDLSLAELRQQVTSKGGTTAAALAIFEQQLPALIDDAMQAAIERAKVMEQSL